MSHSHAYPYKSHFFTHHTHTPTHAMHHTHTHTHTHTQNTPTTYTGVTITKHLVIIISVSVVTSFVLMVFVLVAIITLCVRYHRQRSKPSRAVWELAMGSISVTDDILTEFRRKSSLQKEFLGSPLKDQEDPMEFPRNRLILLDKVLGEINK